MEAYIDLPVQGRAPDLHGFPLICTLHGTSLRPDVVRVRYGMPAIGDRHWLAERHLFPHARPWVAGGCEVDAASHAWVRFCPDCRTSRAAWLTTRWEPPPSHS